MRATTLAQTILIASCTCMAGCASPSRTEHSTHSTPMPLTWNRLADLPDAHGFAGPYAGISNGALIVAGGANFPGGPPWDGGTKAWYDVAFVLPKGETAWRKIDVALPSSRGYGISITTPSGIVCVGGADATQHYADAFALQWKDSQIQRPKLPAFPVAIANCAAAAIGSTIYVACGSESPAATFALNRVFAIDLSAENLRWLELPPLPGPGRIFPVMASVDGDIYVVSGASLAADAAGKPARTYLTDAYRYTPGRGWKQIAEVPRAVVAAPSPAMPTNDGGFTIFGGDDGRNVNFQPKELHPGLSRDILRYTPATNTWGMIGELPLGQVTTTVVPLDGTFIVPTGEIRPAVRTPQVHIADPNATARRQR